jgi:hypothetical protein
MQAALNHATFRIAAIVLSGLRKGIKRSRTSVGRLIISAAAWSRGGVLERGRISLRQGSVGRAEICRMRSTREGGELAAAGVWDCAGYGMALRGSEADVLGAGLVISIMPDFLLVGMH